MAFRAKVGTPSSGFPRAETRASSNVLLVANWPSDTGYAWWLMECFWIAIAGRYQSTGRRVLLCYPELTTVKPSLHSAGIECVEFDFDLTQPRKLEQFIVENRISIVYLSDRPYLSRTYRALRRAGVSKLIIHDHSPGDRTVPVGIKRIAKKLTARLPGLGADAYVAVSPLMRQRLVQSACLPPERCHVATNGLDLRVFSTPVRFDVRKEYDIPDNALLIVSSGRATYYKGIHRIIEAASKVIERLPSEKIYFLHCGDGPDLETFKQRAAEFGLGERFRLIGKTDCVADILRGADIAVHASDGEGLSLAILEFMACGLATTVPDSPTVSQSITHQQNGLTYRSGDANALAETIITLVRSPELRRSLGRAARETVVSEYSLESTVRQLMDVFRQLGV